MPDEWTRKRTYKTRIEGRDCFEAGPAKRAINRGCCKQVVDKISISSSWYKSSINGWAGWPGSKDFGVGFQLILCQSQYLTPYSPSNQRRWIDLLGTVRQTS